LGGGYQRRGAAGQVRLVIGCDAHAERTAYIEHVIETLVSV
jgi:hypothetical protein